MSVKQRIMAKKADFPVNEIITGGLMLGIYWVLALWGVWELGFYALGFNASVFLVGFLLLLDCGLQKRTFWNRAYWKWHLPLLLVLMSYSLFENPFIKGCHIIFLPAACGFLVYCSRVNDPAQPFIKLSQLLLSIIAQAFKPLTAIFEAAAAHLEFLLEAFKNIQYFKSPEVRSAIKGVVLFLLLSGFIIIPLLGSADQAFAEVFHSLYLQLQEWLEEIIRLTLFWKVASVFVVSCLVFAAVCAWSVSDVAETKVEQKPRDAISGAIILGGTLLLYLVFIGLQFEKLWAGSLPIELGFGQVEHYVKTGFWQLVILTAINLALIFLYLHQTSKAVQVLLGCFVLASLLLLGSAAYRMFLYVLYYGLSYEKFYASYAVLYCIALFSFLLFYFRNGTSTQVLRAAVLLLLWMYGVVSILPVESIIVRTNLALSYRPESKIHLSELRMLSPDALAVVQARKDELGRSGQHWKTIDTWIRRQERINRERAWYEMSLSSLLAHSPNSSRMNFSP